MAREPIVVADGLVRQGFFACRIQAINVLFVAKTELHAGVGEVVDVIFDTDSPELAQQAFQLVIAQMEDRDPWDDIYPPRARPQDYQS